MADQLSFLSNSTPAFIEQMYRAYQTDPESVDPTWRQFFKGFDFALENADDAEGVSVQAPETRDVASKEINVLNLINSYRSRGHLFTETNPVRERRKYSPTLDLENYDLSESDLDTVFQAGKDVGLGPITLREILALLDQTYCRSIGAEFRYIRKPEMIKWLQDRMESTRNTPDFSLEKRKHILQMLNKAVIFEKFLGTKFVGQKRFSLEGAETLIPALDAVIEKGAELGI